MLLWTATYVVIVYNGIKYRKERTIIMPLLPGALNYAWETNALIVSKGMWGHILWLGLDTIIVLINFGNIRKKSSKILYLIGIVASTIGIAYVFRLQNVQGMLISAFAIDLLMAISFLVCVRKVSVRGKKLIAMLKLLGDGFACLAYVHQSGYIMITGACVFLINLAYLAACYENIGMNKEKRKR